MNSTEIDSILRRRCRGQFMGVFAIDRLPARLPGKRPLMLVCNTDKHDRPGKHWIDIYVSRDSKGEYFDSFGEPPPPTFKHYLDRICTQWITNDRQLQSAASRFCGQYCVFYCLFKSLDYTLDAINSCFSSDTGLNDAFAHAFVCKML